MNHDIVYYIAQFFGILVTAGVILNLQLKSKRQMLILSIVINLLSSLNVLLLDGFTSGMIICAVAVLQLIMQLWHDHKGTETKVPEMIFFSILYVGGGIIGFEKWIDILAIIAAVLYMTAMFQKKEQRIRLILLANLSTWTVYHAILGSTAFFAQVAGIISSVVALVRYRKK